jgi:hypothetical protein
VGKAPTREASANLLRNQRASERARERGSGGECGAGRRRAGSYGLECRFDRGRHGPGHGRAGAGAGRGGRAGLINAAEEGAGGLPGGVMWGSAHK